jgi:hypothetical protein
MLARLLKVHTGNALGYNTLMILELLRWWYGTGWLQAARRIITWTEGTLRVFSVRLLLRTLFSPWRRIVSVGARSFDQKMRAALDNLVSRCVGFAVRSMVLVTAGLLTAITFASALLLAVLWPVLPLLLAYCVVRGITG